MRSWTLDALEAAADVRGIPPSGASLIPSPLVIGHCAPVLQRIGIDMNAAIRAGRKVHGFDSLDPERQVVFVAALLDIPAIRDRADAPRAEWLAFIFSLADAAHRAPAAADEIRAVALAWSRLSPRFRSEADFLRDWNSFDPHRQDARRIASLIATAREAGFDPNQWYDDEAPALTSPALVTVPAATTAFFRPVLFGTTHLKPVPWLVRGLAVAGDISVIAAPGGTGKTVAVINLLVCIAAGRPSWCGFKILPRPDGQPHRVALIPAEEALERVALMVAAACQANQLSPIEIAAVEANLVVHDARASGLRIGAPRGRGEDICPEAEDRACIELRTALVGISLVVLDTLSAIFALPNENDNSAATTLMRRFGAVLADTGCAGILVHHTPKLTREAAAGQRGEATAVRGAGAIVNSARIVWTFTGVPITEAGLFAAVGANVAAIRRADPVKLNDAAPPDPVFFEVTSELVRIGNGSDVSVRAIRPTVQPSAAAGAIPVALLNVAMRAIDTGATIHGVPGIPLSQAKTGNRVAVVHIAAALRAADPTLPEAHARTAAREVLADLMGRLACVSERTVPVPKFKNGSRNGTDPGKGLVVHWHLAPWTAAPAPAPPPAAAVAAPATVPAGAASAVSPPAQPPLPAVPATTAAP